MVMLYLRLRLECGGKLSKEAITALRRGWYLGDDSFRDQLLNLIEGGSTAQQKKGSHTRVELKSYRESEAERIVHFGLERLEVSDEESQLSAMRKGDVREVAVAMVLKARTKVGNEWITQRLKMGHNRSVSRLIKMGREEPKTVKGHLR